MLTAIIISKTSTTPSWLISADSNWVSVGLEKFKINKKLISKKKKGLKECQ